MSSENEDRRSLDGSENLDGASAPMKTKICYSREFLLSLSNLNICRKLPSGFDDSLISEFVDASIRVPDRPRIPGSLSQHGFRRNDYGSSPPTRVDSGSFSRGTGKWDSRSSGRSDRDSDSQSDKDSDSGRHYGHPSRRSWRTPEHDGLLGSGSFPRPSGYTAPKVRANEHNQLSRSTEPYHPPRPYKAVPHSRRDTDACNDETFGSIDSTNKDRAEEERRRRASFEMMRKEQQKALHEKQKLNVEKHRPGGISDLFEGLEDRKEEKGLFINNNGIAVSAATSASNNDLEISSFAAQSPPLRPLVPPGFKSNTMEKSSGLKSQIQPLLTEVGSARKSMSGEDIVDAEKVDQLTSDDIVVRQQSQGISIVDGMPAEKPKHELLSDQGENVSMPGCLDVPIKKPFIDDQLACLPNDIDSHTALDDSAIAQIGANVFGEKTASNKNSTSILEKIFGSTLSLNDDQASSVLFENLDNKPDGTWNQSSVQSSKFTPWFFEDDSKMADDVSSARPNNLLSLIASGDKGNVVLSAQVCTNNKDEAFSTVLTCEDLEQSILSEFSAKATEVQPVLESGSSITGTDNELRTVHADDHASLHLLSMLQKGPELGNMPMNFCADTSFSDGVVSREQNMATAVNEHEAVNNSTSLPNLGKTLTLETLFGTAFMKELQSVDAPVSVQRGPMDSAREDASKPHGLAITDNGFPLSMADKSEVQTPNHDYSMPSNPGHHATLSQADNGVGFDDSSIGMTSSPNLLPKAMPKHSVHDRFVGFQLPEEAILISSSDTKDSQVSSFMQTGNSVNNSNIRLDAPVNIAEKMAALGPINNNWGMEGSDSRPLPWDSFEQMEPQILHHNLHVQQPSSYLQWPQMSHQSSPLYPHLEAHPSRMGSQMNFLHPEPTFSPDSLHNRQFASSLNQPPFHHPSVRVPGYDIPPQHSLLHQMQIPGNRPPHMLPDFPRGGPVPHHGNQPAGFIQEMNPMQGLPLGPHQPNIASSRFPIPGNPPEALQRLIEMELRANSKQNHHRAPGHSQGAYSHEVDMGFQYR